jgi:hypothetical protein
MLYQTDQSFAASGIGQDRIQAWLAKIPAKKSILIFDTCESGSLTMVQLASLRGGFEQKAAIGRLVQATGRTTLAASLDNQPALEGYRVSSFVRQAEYVDKVLRGRALPISTRASRKASWRSPSKVLVCRRDEQLRAPGRVRCDDIDDLDHAPYDLS